MLRMHNYWEGTSMFAPVSPKTPARFVSIIFDHTFVIALCKRSRLWFGLVWFWLPCRIHLPICFWIMDPHSTAQKKNTSHENEMLPQDTMHLTKRPCYQRGSLCQDPADNRSARRPLDHRKETQTAVVWTCLPFIRSGQNLARHSERGKKTRQTKEEVGRQQ